jgi:hypothetical protein
VERVTGFYRSVFGWKIERWGEMPYWMVTTGPDGEPGINGGILPRRDPAQPCVNTVGVANLEGGHGGGDGKRRVDLRAEDGDTDDRVAGVWDGPGGECLRDDGDGFGGEVRTV